MSTAAADHAGSTALDGQRGPTAPSGSRSTTDHSHLFDLAHSSRSAHHHAARHNLQSHVHDVAHPLSWRHLFKPPVVRQWLAGDILARETGKREAARFELVYDLAFIAIIHQLAEGTSESDSSWDVLRFVVAFFLAFSVWTNTRSFINTSGTDDVPQRVYIFVVMALLLGFSSNASAIEIECPESADVANGPGTMAATAQLRLHRPISNEGSALQYFELFETKLPGGCELAEGWRTNARGAIMFFLTAKLVRVVQCTFYGYRLPRFRDGHILRALAIALGSAFYIPLLLVSHPIHFLVLPIVAIVFELALSYAVAVGFRFFGAVHQAFFKALSLINPFGTIWKRIEDSSESADKLGTLTPAQNLEHIIERNALFVVLVLGEMVINITFKATGSSAGIADKYLRCVLGLAVPFLMNWIYADNSTSRTFLHAIRRNWVTSITWSHLHFPLTASLGFASAALPGLISSYHANFRTRASFGCGLGTAMATLCVLGSLHKSLDTPGSGMTPRYYRLLARLFAGLVFAGLPFADLSSTAFLGIIVATLIALVVLEMVGKLGAVGSEDRIKQALSINAADEPDLEAQHHHEHDLHHEAAMEAEHKHKLTENELGQDDVGNDGTLGDMGVTRVGRKQRLAYAC